MGVDNIGSLWAYKSSQVAKIEVEVAQVETSKTLRSDLVRLDETQCRAVIMTKLECFFVLRGCCGAAAGLLRGCCTGLLRGCCGAEPTQPVAPLGCCHGASRVPRGWHFPAS